MINRIPTFPTESYLARLDVEDGISGGALGKKGFLGGEIEQGPAQTGAGKKLRRIKMGGHVPVLPNCDF